MKHVILFYFLFFLCLNIAEAQTNANIAGTENVLVVYRAPVNENDTISQGVKNYYRDARGIPTSNIVGINLPDTSMTVDGVTHWVGIRQGTDLVRDLDNHTSGTWYASEHAWKYFYQYIANPIKNYITANNLTSIRYIVLCKGVPFKIQAGADSGSVICNLAVDGLLSMLNSNNYEDLLHAIYTQYRSYAIDGSHYYYWLQPQITNPYYNADPNLNMSNRFLPGAFTRNWNGHAIKLDYLISHLDGISYDMVKSIIDRSSEAPHADNYDWFIDADPQPCHGGTIMVDFANSTAAKLNSLGFSNYSFDVTEDTVTHHNKPIISYSSNGVHTTKPPNTFEGQTLHPDYIQTQLNFTYVPGAIFNTAESFNAHSLSAISRRPGAEMGQLVEFFLKGGTVSVGHAYEPYVSGVVNDGKMLPSYQLGYSFIDAAYMGMQYLAWQNVVVGDPLTAIAWGKQTLTENKTLTGTNLVTGEVTIPSGKTMSIQNNSTIKLRHQGLITTGSGILSIGSGVTINTDSWSRSVLLSNNGNNPRLVWAAHPSFSTSFFKVYRAVSNTPVSDPSTLTYALRYTSPDASTFNFTDNEIMIGSGQYFYYYVTANLVRTPKPPLESDRSNYTTIRGGMYKKGNTEEEPLTKNFSFSLDQNFPNPFNPETMISYQLASSGVVTLRIFDVLGNQIAELVNGIQPAGRYRTNFQSTGYHLSSGVYFYQLKTDRFIETKKMLILK